MTMIIILLVLLALLIVSVVLSRYFIKQYDKHCEIVEKNADKYADLNIMYFQWIKVHQNGKSIADYFHKNGLSRVAVYGLNEIGYSCLDELERNGISVDYCIDRNADNIFSRVKVYNPNNELPHVDAVLVAVPQYFDTIYTQMSEKMKCPIVSLADVVWEV